jgi:hypothetical protein
MVKLFIIIQNKKEIDMKKVQLLFPGLIMSMFLTIGFLWIGSSPSSAELPSLATRGDELPPVKQNTEIQSAAALPAPIPGETLVYFFTADSDATATVINMLNTDSVPHTVALRGYSATGVLGYSLNITIDATSIVRLASDSIVAGAPPSWTTPAPIITNFTDFTFFASLSLPRGVKVDGYVLFNPGTGTVDPRLDQGAIPLRFMTDMGGVFLPAVFR